MGTLYDLKCTHCGYSYSARYGSGCADFDDNAILKRKFEEGKAEPGFQSIYDAIKDNKRITT